MKINFHKFLILASVFFVTSVVQLFVFAQTPSWWTNRSVLTTNDPNDFAPVNSCAIHQGSISQRSAEREDDKLIEPL